MSENRTVVIMVAVPSRVKDRLQPMVDAMVESMIENSTSGQKTAMSLSGITYEMFAWGKFLRALAEDPNIDLELTIEPTR